MNQEQFITVNDSEGTNYPLEIYHYTSSEAAKVVIERGFSSKTMTMTPQDARKFAQAILDVTTEPARDEFAKFKFSDNPYKAIGQSDVVRSLLMEQKVVGKVSKVVPV